MTRSTAAIALVWLWFGLTASCAPNLTGGAGNNGGAGGSNTGGAGGANTGGGVPVSCQQDQDCPAGPCETAACVQGTCKQTAVTDLATDRKPDARGDCKKYVCDKAVLIEVEDTSDIPDDGNDCTSDSCNGQMPAHQAATAGSKCVGGYCYVNPSAGTASCEECANGLSCATQLCVSGFCIYPHCTDGQSQPNTESDIDCGKDCPPCAPGKLCATGDDCESQVCTNNVCAEPTCTDGKWNGTETADDCGGECPDKCGDGYACLAHTDCKSGQCYQGYCLPPSCQDNVMNGDEAGVDCGGTNSPCPPCPP